MSIGAIKAILCRGDVLLTVEDMVCVEALTRYSDLKRKLVAEFTLQTKLDCTWRII